MTDTLTTRKGIWCACSLLLIGLLATLLATGQEQHSLANEAKRDFDFACSQIQLRITARMHAHEQILFSAAALFDASEQVTREAWHRFSRRQRFEHTLPGIQGIGFAQVIPRGQLAQHLQEIRSQGLTDYKVRPEGERELYTSIVYLEPISDRNLRAFGYDMFSEPVRQAAMERARDRNAAVLSGKVTLVQETDENVQAGTLMYVPVYSKDMATDTVAQRRAALQGWVYSPYRMNDLMQGILGGWENAAGKRIRVQIYDGEQLSAAALLYDSQPKGGPETADGPPRLTLQTPVTFNDHLWHLRFTQTDPQMASVRVYGVLIAGIIISLLVFGLVLSLVQTRTRAKQLADQLTKELQESEEKYRILFNNEIYAICIFDLETFRLLDANNAFCHVYGYDRDELVTGMTINDITVEQQASDAATQQAVNEGTLFIPLRYHRKKDGTVFPVEIVGGPYVWQGRKVMFGLIHDITERMQTDAMLRASEERFRMIFQDVQSIAVQGYGPDGTTQYWNHASELLYGYSAQEALGRNLADLVVPPEMQEDVKQAMQQMAETGQPIPASELTLMRKDGSRVIVFSNHSIVNVPGQEQELFCIDIDLTERKNAEKELQESEEKYRTIFENQLMAICLWDLATYQFIDINNTHVQLYGYSREELLGGMTVFDLTAEPEVSKDTIQQALAAGNIFVPLRYHKKKDGTVFPVEIVGGTYVLLNGRQVMFGMVRDISSRIQMEDVLRHAKERLELALQANPFAIWDWDVLTDELYYSPRWWDIIGYENNELAADSALWRRLMHPDDLERADAVVSNALAAETTFEIETRLLHKHGYYVPVLTRGFILRDANARAVRITGTNIDLTERKLVAEKQRQWERKLQQMQKVESLSRMAGSIAHHFNNILGAVLGNLEMAMEDLPQKEAPYKRLNIALQATEKAVKVSGLLLTYLGQNVTQKELLDFSEVCRDSIPLFNGSIPKNIVVETDFPLPGPAITADISLIRQTLTNLVTNAAEAIGDAPGTISLSLAIVAQPDIAAANRFPLDWHPHADRFACLEIRDTGAGIADQNIDKIFDPFFSSKFTGRGLGLSVILGILRSHHGGVTVTSELGRGSVFRIYLPVSAPAPPLHQHAVIGDTIVDPGCTVLVVEDEAVVRTMVEAMLIKSGFTVLVARDGAEAVEVFRQHQDTISVVLCDLTMPNMDGWQTLTALRALAPDIRVVLASGYDATQVMQGEHAHAPQVFLQKPYKIKELRSALMTALKAPVP